MSSSDLPPSKQSYMYRPLEVQHGRTPLLKRLVRYIEKINKFVTLRLLGIYLRVHKLPSPLPLDKVSSVLFIRYDALGDMIVTTPLWRILKKLKPSIHIGVAGSSKNIGILSADNDVDIIYDYSAASFRDIIARTKLARQVNWDLVILCKFNQKTRGGIISRLSTQTGYNVTIGTPNIDGHQALFSRLVPPPDKPLQMTLQLQHLLRSCITLPDMPVEHPSIRVDLQTEERIRNTVNGILTKDSSTKYIVLNVDSPEVRKWGLDNNILLAKHIEKTYTDISVVMLSLPENQEKVRRSINDAHLSCTHYLATNDILELVSILRHSYIVVTPDTGIAHVASAEKKPILGFYPEAGEWLPFETNYIVILPENGKKIRDIPLNSASSNLDLLIKKLDENVSADIRDIVSL
jgi:ADP-heptose:LPS heptosyltransferase